MPNDPRGPFLSPFSIFTIIIIIRIPSHTNITTTTTITINLDRFCPTTQANPPASLLISRCPRACLRHLLSIFPSPFSVKLCFCLLLAPNNTTISITAANNLQKEQAVLDICLLCTVSLRFCFCCRSLGFK